MAKINSIELDNIKKLSGNSYNGRVKVFSATFDLSKFATPPTTTDLLKLCTKPHGGILLGIIGNSSAANAKTFTVNGESKDAQTEIKTLVAGKYGAVAAVTTANTPVLVNFACANADQTLYDEEITLTPSGALPAAGILNFLVLVGLC
jgi:hypothetical protein